MINKYNLKDATDSDWCRYRAVLSNNYWSLATQYFSASQKVSYLAKTMENAVAEVFPLEENTFGYKIPRIMKKKMRRRTWLDKKLMITLNSQCFLDYKTKLRALEFEISASHAARNAKTEGSMIEKLEDNPALFYSYVRSFGRYW